MAYWIRQVAFNIQRLSATVDRISTAVTGAITGRLYNIVRFYDATDPTQETGRIVTTKADGQNGNPRFQFHAADYPAPFLSFIGPQYDENTGAFVLDRVSIDGNTVFMPYITADGVSGNIYMDSFGGLHKVPSSRRFKTNIDYAVDWQPVIDALLTLTPVSFEYPTRPGMTMYGLIAEDVDEAGEHMHPFVDYDENGLPAGLNNFIGGLIALAQSQERRIASLEERLSALEGA
jgi:hypothetical protein